MKIGLDYTSIAGSAGAGTYARELIKNLSLIDKDNIYYLYNYLHKKFYHQDKLIKQNNFKYRFAISPYLPIVKFFRKSIFSLSYKLNKLDLFHVINASHYYPSLDNFVITIHDLAPLYEKGFVKDNTILFYKKYFKQIIDKANIIIVDANFTKKDILNRFNILEDKIKVIPLAANKIFKPTKNLEILRKYNIKKQYILSVGQLQPRKNLPTLLKAYSLLPKDLKDIYDLVLIGPPRDKDSLNYLKKIINQEKINNYVKILKYVDIKDLVILYSHAYIFAYLSLLEGFGLPVLESLQCGRPVLISNNSTLPEVAGSASIMANPNNIEEILFKLKESLEKREIINNLVKKIPNQIKKFSWQKTAKKTLETYIISK